ncbi:MAG: ATP-dependent RNA helicase HrpA [Spartobacteria bacterium]|nr:ATP-dependent RNA helicase HrpA [Spartobacteria bacterium]
MVFDELCAMIRAQSASFRLQDRYRLEQLAGRIRMRLKRAQPVEKMLLRLEDLLLHAMAMQEALAKDPAWVISYPQELPVSRCRDDIVASIRKSQVIIVCGATGSGKTTQLPKMVVEAGFGRLGRVGCTQPRRIAAVSMARRVAQELGCPLGREVGYQVRFDDSTSDATRIKFMTDGILLAETQNDRDLLQYDALIIDEAHERSLNIDFLLGYIKRLLELRPELRVVISSATLDAAMFSEFFANAPVFEVEGRMFPVEDMFFDIDADEELSTSVLHAAEWINDVDRDGDILVFLPGEREISDCLEKLSGRHWDHTEVLPLYGRLNMAEQQRIFNRGSDRRIILATNVAETSITIPDIHYVIDSGLVRLSRYNPGTQVQHLQIEQVSQASSRQRRGRCGRVGPGICLHLYSEEVFENSAEYTDPEIRRTALAGVILQMKTLRLPDIEEFPFINPPQISLVREGYKMLYDISALDRQKNITSQGRDISRFPLDPHLARMILQGRTENVLSEMLVITAFLSIQDPRERPMDKKELADKAHAQWKHERSDYISILQLWNTFVELQEKGSQSKMRRFCRQYFLSYRRMQEWRNLYLDLASVAQEFKWMKGCRNIKEFENFDYDAVHKAILAGIPSNIGVKVEKKQYRAARNREFYLFPGSGLFDQTPEWVVAFELVQTGRLYGRYVAEIAPDWLLDVAPHLCKATYHGIHWSEAQGFVYAEERIISGGLLIREGVQVHYGRVDPVETRNLFIREGLVPGRLRLRHPFLKQQRARLRKIDLLEAKIRRPHSLLNVGAIEDFFREVIPDDVFSAKGLDQWLAETGADIVVPLDRAMYPIGRNITPEEYPDVLVVDNHRLKLKYTYNPGEKDDGITLFCPQKYVPLLTDDLLERVVPGWLPQKVELWFKSLPTKIRMPLQPFSRSALEFLDWLRDQPDQPSLIPSLSAWVREQTGEFVGDADFSRAPMPAWLRINAAVTDVNGTVVRCSSNLDELAEETLSDTVGAVLPTDLRKHGMTEWLEHELPEKIAIKTKQGEEFIFPALIDEGQAVGIAGFLTEAEADKAHAAGLVRFFRLKQRDNIRFLERKLPLPTQVHLQMGLDDPKGTPLVDLMDGAIYQALTDGERYSIRTPSRCRERIEAARTALYDHLESHCRILADVYKSRDALRRQIARLPAHPATKASSEDITIQLQWLFRSGFMQVATWQFRYPLYMKALSIRVERLKFNPDKDQLKLRNVLPYREKLNTAIHNSEDIPWNPQHIQFHLMLEDFRINTFAPEIKAYEKASAKRLDGYSL